MKKILLLVMLSLSQVAMSQDIISMPSKQYLMSGVENKIFVQTFTRKHFLDGDIVRFEGDASYAKGGVREKYAMLKEPKDGQKIEVKLYDGEEYSVKETKSSEIRVGDPTQGKGVVRVQFLGDSFTKGCYFRDAFIDKGYVPNVKLIGTRRVPDAEGYFHEGRGGWSMYKYYSNNPRSSTFHNPYYQPEGDLNYWGGVDFWKTAYMLNKEGGAGKSLDVRYNCGDYDTSRFGEDGYLVNPSKNDMMYDRSKDSYVVWTGKKWSKIEEPKEWDFDYSKYLKMWGFESPEYLVVMLGLNDFRDDLSLPIDFTEWNALVERMFVSYKKAVPNGRLLLSTPCTSCGVLDNESGAFTLRKNTMMWHVRENIIKEFDGREAEGLIVVDASATIDNENGYNTKGDMQVGNSHPYPNYPALGVPLAACVQYFREK
ncbi:MAG: hypothetical protein SNG10_01880 [Rikenellaceae bacterium]